MDKLPEQYKLPKLTQEEVHRSERFSIYLELDVQPISMSSQWML